MTKDNTVGELLALYRKQRGWSQAALAAEAHVETRTVQRLERGETQSADTISRVIRALGVSQNELDAVVIFAKTLPTMTRVPRIKYGDELARLVRHSMAYLPQILTDKRNIRGVANRIAADCDDWSGLLDEPQAMLSACESLGATLDELEAVGGKLFAKLIKMNAEWVDKEGKPVVLDTLLLSVRESDFVLNLSDEQGEYTFIGSEDTVQSIQEMQTA